MFFRLISKLTLGMVELRTPADAFNATRFEAAAAIITDEIRGKLTSALTAEGFTGDVAFAGEKDKALYETLRSRPFYYNHCNFPAVFLVPNNASDVQVILRVLAGMRHVLPPLAIASGCHTGNAVVEGSVVLDMQRIKTVKVDAENFTVTVGGGAKLIDVDRALAPFKLGFVTGTNGDTGVAGLTMAGGAGYLTRKHGFGCDNVLEVQVVLATGELVVATDGEVKELYSC
jgi:FAD/FMN-containing dehydrogenase